MSFSGLLVQLLNGLASASSLFLVSAGLSLIFGVMRIVNFAHGSFFMLGIYVAYSLVEQLGAAIGFWPALLLAPLVTAAVGALVEVVLLRRIYRAPELFQLLATFALVLVIKDAVLWAWGTALGWPAPVKPLMPTLAPAGMSAAASSADMTRSRKAGWRTRSARDMGKTPQR